MKLNLGCGKDYREGWTNLDRSNNIKCDVVHNVDSIPYPFEDNTFDEIMCREILEHVNDLIAVMEELHRISKPGAIIHITVPHYSCANAFMDPTHKRFFSYYTMNYFTGENQWDFYTQCRFRTTHRYLKFLGNYKNWHWEKLANRFPRFYEEHLAWIAPAWYLSFKLEVLK